MHKQWILTTKRGETIEGLSSDDAARAIEAIIAGQDPQTGRTDDTHEFELEMALAA